MISKIIKFNKFARPIIFNLTLPTLLLSLTNPKPVYGQINNPALGNSLQNLSGSAFFARFLPALITLFFFIGSVVFILMILQGGIEWMTSGGDKTSYENARNRITNALTGLFILFSLYVIINLIEIFFDINIMVFNITDLAI
jgi:hypothetical protein